ncbi:hypothetical protein ACF1BE_10410 [Streptomyces sp. NPDC014991]|uniref:hypothetical protein n=1 Tax=Streptomyces sp. NPDC014991 TaxID=3364935 RepID=UPI0036FBDF79
MSTNRTLITAFAELAAANPERGVPVFGVDLSPALVAVARTAHVRGGEPLAGVRAGARGVRPGGR